MSYVTDFVPLLVKMKIAGNQPNLLLTFRGKVVGLMEAGDSMGKVTKMMGEEWRSIQRFITKLGEMWGLKNICSRDFFREKNIALIDWPEKSTDLNPISFSLSLSLLHY